MKNLKIWKKLLLTFSVILLLYCISVLISIVSLKSNGNNFESFYDNGYNITNKVMDVRRAMQASAKYVGYSMMTSDNAKTQEYIESAKKENETMESGIAYMEEHFRGDKTLVKNFKDALNGIQGDRDSVYQLASDNQNTKASELYFEMVMPGYLKANEYLKQIYAEASANADGEYSQAQHSENTTIVLVTIVAILSFGVATALAFSLTRSLTAPIHELEHAAREISKGSLKVDINYSSQDELGSLAKSMRLMTAGVSAIVKDVDYLLGEMASGNFDVHTEVNDSYIGDYSPILASMRNINSRLSDALMQINESSNQVSSGSEQVSSASQSLSQGATEQASSVEELAATINEVSEQVKGTADYAREANEQTNAAGEEVIICNQQMNDMINAMKEISDASNQIGKIIKTIEDIAFQTNILALNAAVEAARAGEAGKGFAVVADEVRNLASKSAEASKDTSALIEGSIKAVTKGTELVNATAETLKKVVEDTESVASIVEKISDAAKTQADSIVQITQGIDQISGVVQNNSATAEESAASSEELSGQAQMLKELVGQFKLKQGGPAPAVSKSDFYVEPIAEQGYGNKY